MSTITKAATVLGLTVLVAACGGRNDAVQDDAVFVPVTPEPVSTKY
ncbi:hypothetical protein JSE7799_02991 [Jannaschia seosinensis]|uniref:Uncharacterized protein n=1 Tax=Jannaschia seosinensis TaxID=313367 RepID=A0A0M7BCZ1_9RHOB|nr:hypothetical protein [Jannaschia seosinensis]CUH40261.1 hypothetical protein JSE7799_02991 [Jannaschia seosinensis]